MKMTDTDTPTVLFGIRRDRSDTGIGTMTSTPNVNELRRRLERDCETLQEQIRNTTEALRTPVQDILVFRIVTLVGQIFRNR